MDNKQASLDQAQVEAFAHFFCRELAARGIPWSLNELEHFYDTSTNTWVQRRLFGQQRQVELNMAAILRAAREGHAAGLANPIDPAAAVTRAANGASPSTATRGRSSRR
jgi:hypothetical protein